VNNLPSDFLISNLEGNRISILGHGGNGFHKKEPINSLESFLKVIDHRNDGTELDVQITRDSILIAFHDQLIDEVTDCEGGITDHVWSKLVDCNSGEQISMVRNVLSLDWKAGTIFSFDVKKHQLDPKNERAFVNELKRIRIDYPNYRFLFESPDIAFLEQLKLVGLGDLYIYCSDPIQGMELCAQLGLSGISINNKLISKEQVELSHDRGFKVMIWGVGSAWDNRDAVLKSPDFIQTDNIRHLQQLLAE